MSIILFKIITIIKISSLNLSWGQTEKYKQKQINRLTDYISLLPKNASGLLFYLYN